MPIVDSVPFLYMVLYGLLVYGCVAFTKYDEHPGRADMLPYHVPQCVMGHSCSVV